MDDCAICLRYGYLFTVVFEGRDVQACVDCRDELDAEERENYDQYMRDLGYKVDDDGCYI